MSELAYIVKNTNKILKTMRHEVKTHYGINKGKWTRSFRANECLECKRLIPPGSLYLESITLVERFQEAKLSRCISCGYQSVVAAIHSNQTGA